MDTWTIETSCERILIDITKRNIIPKKHRKPIIPIDKVGRLVYDVQQLEERRRRYVTGSRVQTKYRYVLSNV